MLQMLEEAGGVFLLWALWGALISGTLTQTVKTAVKQVFSSKKQPVPSSWKSVFTVLPLVLGAAAVALTGYSFDLPLAWGVGLGVVGGGSSSAVVKIWSRLLKTLGRRLERTLEGGGGDEAT